MYHFLPGLQTAYGLILLLLCDTVQCWGVAGPEFETAGELYGMSEEAWNMADAEQREDSGMGAATFADYQKMLRQEKLANKARFGTEFPNNPDQVPATVLLKLEL